MSLVTWYLLSLIDAFFEAVYLHSLTKSKHFDFVIKNPHYFIPNFSNHIILPFYTKIDLRNQNFDLVTFCGLFQMYNEPAKWQIFSDHSQKPVIVIVICLLLKIFLSDPNIVFGSVFGEQVNHPDLLLFLKVKIW